MEWLWTWSGRCFGYRDGDNLWTHNGEHVGKFHGEEIFGSNGRYLGEVKNGKLITDKRKRTRSKGVFTPYANRCGYAKRADHAGFAMYAGYEDFPYLEE